MLGRQGGEKMLKYRTFLMELGEDLLEAIRECENWEFHHAPPESVEWQHYLRLATWMEEVAARLAHYGNSKSRQTKYTSPVLPTWTQENNSMVRHDRQRELERERDIKYRLKPPDSE